MFNIGGVELIVILVVAFVVLGPEKLPKVMRTVGKTLGNFRRASTEFQRAINTDIVLDAPKTMDPTAPPSSSEEPAGEAAVQEKPAVKNVKPSARRRMAMRPRGAVKAGEATAGQANSGNGAEKP